MTTITISISLPKKIAKKLEFLPFEKKPLSQVRKEFEKTGKYSKKFVDNLIKGLSESSLYEDKAAK